MDLGLFGRPCREMNFMQIADYAKEYGLDAIEPFPHAEFAIPDDSAVEAAKRLADYTKEIGLKISCFSLPINITTGDKIAENIERLKGFARVAAAMGSPYLHHTLMPLSVANFNGAPRFDEALKIAVSGIREVYDYAESIGVKAIYEDQGFLFNGCERFDRLLNAVDRDIKVVADLGNILFVGEDPTDFVGQFAPYIAHVHVKDYLYKSAKSPYPGDEWCCARNGDYLRGTIAGHGVVDFTTCCRILIAAGYTGSFSLEFEGMENFDLATRLSAKNFRRYYAQAEAILATKA